MCVIRKLDVKQYEYQSPEERYSVKITYGGKALEGIQADAILAVEEEVMSWWKVNYIHAWFVDNVQGSQDDCREYPLSVDDIVRLYNVCVSVISASVLVKGSVLKSKSWNSENDNWDEHWQPGKVIKDTKAAKAFLPTREGSFFGNLHYDEDYYNEVVRTRDWADRMLQAIEAGVPGELYYSSSW